MLILYRLLKLAIICAVFFTIYDVIEFGEITWFERLLAALGF
ncbi:membrane protein [Vibrio tubiashii]|nr:membrane protein [Vibrio tubiashii]